jgi:hypothetical protein
MSAAEANNATARIAAKWFQAAEASGDFMGIRYGRGTVGSEAVSWTFVPHAECDGIGGFARLLREQGDVLPTLPTTTNPKRGWVRPVWNLWRASRADNDCALRADWALYDTNPAGASQAVAWHLFTEAETQQIRQYCRQHSVSVNSYLLQQLDLAVRPDIHSPEGTVRWIVPVNLRGAVNHGDDTANHVSYIQPCIGVGATVSAIQQQIDQRLRRNEHWGNYLVMLWVGGLVSAGAMLQLVLKDRTKPQGNIGAFSNLGVWDSTQTMASEDFWLFCPPVSKGQLLGAGCVTFQNRLSLTLQGHPGLSDRPELAKNWVARGVEGARCAAS